MHLIGGAEASAGGNAGLKFKAGSGGVSLSGMAWVGSEYEANLGLGVQILDRDLGVITIIDTNGPQELTGRVGQVDYKEIWRHDF